jgi:hypothetical protein
MPGQRDAPAHTGRFPVQGGVAEAASEVSWENTGFFAEEIFASRHPPCDETVGHLIGLTGKPRYPKLSPRVGKARRFDRATRTGNRSREL